MELHNSIVLNADHVSYNNQHNEMDKSFHSTLEASSKVRAGALLTQHTQRVCLSRVLASQRNPKQAPISSSCAMKHHHASPTSKAVVWCRKSFPCCNTILRKKCGGATMCYLDVDIVEKDKEVCAGSEETISTWKVMLLIWSSFWLSWCSFYATNMWRMCLNDLHKIS